MSNLSINLKEDGLERFMAWIQSAWQFILEKVPLINTLADRLHIPPVVVAVVAVVLVLVILRIFSGSKKTKLLNRKTISDIDISQYNDDIFFGIRWRWQCDGSFSVEKIKHTAQPLCPHCNRPLNMVAKEATTHSAARVQ